MICYYFLRIFLYFSITKNQKTRSYRSTFYCRKLRLENTNNLLTINTTYLIDTRTIVLRYLLFVIIGTYTLFQGTTVYQVESCTKTMGASTLSQFYSRRTIRDKHVDVNPGIPITVKLGIPRLSGARQHAILLH